MHHELQAPVWLETSIERITPLWEVTLQFEGYKQTFIDEADTLEDAIDKSSEFAAKDVSYKVIGVNQYDGKYFDPSNEPWASHYDSGYRIVGIDQSDRVVFSWKDKTSSSTIHIPREKTSSWLSDVWCDLSKKL